LLDTRGTVKKLAVLVLVVLGLVAAFVWWPRTAEAPGEAPTSDPSTSNASTVTAEIARVRLEARARGEIDVSPCSAGGRVLDLASGRGLANALIQLRPYGFGRPTAPDDPGGTADREHRRGWRCGRSPYSRPVAMC
jgi:hypothetical protein